MANLVMNNATFERKLNREFQETLTFETALEKFEYMTVKGRAGGHCSRKAIINAWDKGRLGSLLRKYDSIAFEVARNDSR
jgi:hypothetical protein